ncbi:hypothetical protein KXW36_009781, partial [Aspergillus fumigatus]
RHRACGGRRVVLGGSRRDARPRRRIRLWQVDRGAQRDASGRTDLGADLPRRRRHHPSVQGRAAHPSPFDADRVPGPVRLAQPAPVGRRHHRRRPQRASAKADGSRARRPRRQGDAGRRPRSGMAGALSPRILRRPAPARRHGPRHRAQSQGVPVRRAAVESRRQAARADAHRDQEGTPESPHHDSLRHPRPGRGDDTGRPRR